MISCRNERLDAVWIDTLPGQHLYWAMHVASIRHSLPHVKNPPRYICLSRPMLGRSYEETATMAAALQARDLVLLPAPLTDLEKRVQWVQNTILDIFNGGHVQFANYQYTMASNQRDDDDNDDDDGDDAYYYKKTAADVHGGGIVLEMGPVVLRLVEMLFGPLENVQGQALNRNSPLQDVEDYVWMKATAGTVDFQALWDMTRATPISLDCLTLQTSSKRDDGDTLQIHGLMTKSVVEIYRRNENKELVARRDFGHDKNNVAACLAQVTDRIQREMPQVDLKATFRFSTNIDRILTSYYGGRGDDFFARPSTWPGIPPKRRQLYLDQQKGG